MKLIRNNNDIQNKKPFYIKEELSIIINIRNVKI
tara:strand:+ start:2156 stop:2257 length:102 start_codon:yes stop_codon:yes gene_type:complete